MDTVVRGLARVAVGLEAGLKTDAAAMPSQISPDAEVVQCAPMLLAVAAQVCAFLLFKVLLKLK